MDPPVIGRHPNPPQARARGRPKACLHRLVSKDLLARPHVGGVSALQAWMSLNWLPSSRTTQSFVADPLRMVVRRVRMVAPGARFCAGLSQFERTQRELQVS